MVLGMISDKTRIRIVSTAEIIPKYTSPKTLTASAPTPAEPTVWAMVFKERMAEIGLSISCFKRFINGAFFAPSCSFMVMKETGVERRTASRTEHKKDTDNANNK